MVTNDKTPLGYVELPGGSKAIYPMNDIFLTYTFEDAAHWEALRIAVNLIIDAYIQANPATMVKPILGNIKVRTQFKHLLSTDGKTTRDQDIKITEGDDSSSYIEFQNRANTNPPVEIRSVEYFGLGIGHSRGKIANQMWLLAEDVESVLHQGTFARYILSDEVTGNAHPNSSGIMYISLTRLSQEDSPAGELAQFLLGKISMYRFDEVRKIATAFNTSFDAFKADKEVARMLTLAERYIDEGEARGMAIGEARGEARGEAIGEANILNKAKELQKSGLSAEDILRLLINESNKQDPLLTSN